MRRRQSYLERHERLVPMRVTRRFVPVGFGVVRIGVWRETGGRRKEKGERARSEESPKVKRETVCLG